MKSFFCILATLVVAANCQRLRQGRQQGAGGGYGAPPQQQPQYGSDLQSDASSPVGSQSDHQGLDWLLQSVPGQPGTDYPIYAEVPQTSFTCDGKVEGGYYADPEAECQAFHVCTSDGLGSLATYSFLCPNGTIFNQGYFICDWWFNFDCSEASGLYSRNDEVAAEREAATLNAATGSLGSASSGSSSYASPPSSAGSQPAYGGGIDLRQGRRGFN